MARIQQERLAAKVRGELGFAVKIGLNSGPTVVGNVGMEKRYNYTAVGETVNVASRLESVPSLYACQVVVGPRTAELAHDAILLCELDWIQVKGKETPLAIFEPLAPCAMASEAQRTYAARFAEALAHYRAMRFTAEVARLTAEAVVLYNAGELAQAEALLKQALAVLEQALGAEHPEVATSLNNLAALYYAQSHYAEAEALHKRVLAIREQTLGAEHPSVATSLTNLAMVYGAQGRCAEAEPLYQRALAIDERALRSDHPTVTTRLNNLAALYDSQGRYAQGEPLYRRALAIVEQALGPEHPLAARSLNNLVNLLEQSQPSHARQLYQRARRIFLRVAQVNIDLHDEALRGLLRESQQALQANMAFLARLARQSQSTPKAMSPAWEAFEVAEQLRGGAAYMALAQAGARAATGSPTTAQLARQGQDMRQQWRAVRTQLTAEYGKSAPQRNATRVAQLQQDERQLDDALAAATRRLRTVFPQYAALLMPEPIELAAVAALLQPHEALVSFFTLPDRLLVWLVRPNIQAEVAVIDASNMIVMPGFVDTHRHIWEGILRSILPNGLLSDYLRDITGAARAVYRPEDAYAGNLVSTLGAINAGITTLLDWSHIGNSPEHTDAAIAALQDAGIRAVYAYGGGIAGPANKFPQDIHRLRAQYFSSADQLLTLAMATGINAAHWAVAREVGASPSMPTAQTNCSRWRRP